MLTMPDLLTTTTLHLLLNYIQIKTIKADHRQNEPENQLLRLEVRDQSC